MNRIESVRATLLIAGILVAFLQPGCKRASSTGPAGAPDGPGNAAVKVQLADPRADVVVDVVNGRVVYVAHCKVKYRFVEGRPQAGVWYNFAVNLDNAGVGMLKTVDGSGLSPEGEVEGKIPLIKASPGLDLAQMKAAKVDLLKPDPATLPAQAEFTAEQGSSKNGPFRAVGDKTSCPVKAQQTYPVPNG